MMSKLSQAYKPCPCTATPFLATQRLQPTQSRQVLQSSGPVRAVAQGTEAAEELLERASSSSSSTPDVSNGTGAVRLDGKAFRRALGKNGKYIRQPKNDPDSLALMDTHGVGYSTTGLVAQMRANGNRWQHKDVRVKLAQAFGYCWGVQRAVEMAYEARKQYPGHKLHITNEIIHNPAVNQRLKEMDISIIKEQDGVKDFGGIKSDDVVILPAFGASLQEMMLLSDRGVNIVDTTCPWVAKVWNAVDRQARKSHTSIIHGKYSHEETVATASFATTYLIVRDLTEAQEVCDYIINGGDKQAFLQKYSKAISEGFDPDRDLVRVGLANQTTMLRDETLEIGKMLERTMMQKYGPAELKEHYMVMDTICDATQERQTAVYDLVDKKPDMPEPEKLDMMIVVGGFNSSNTSHLQEIPEMRGIPSFW
ncbi:hypothetical protein WJX84_010530 [Apatococcus fuscideae]|uniref:4-hydroxy-3-methylbut-2-enyl diphosphate reductase n=1 Tax=Apatococcus fuscideae TaxID=2026836 RepID=A0AAW1RQ84_9CHLO